MEICFELDEEEAKPFSSCEHEVASITDARATNNTLLLSQVARHHGKDNKYLN